MNFTFNASFDDGLDFNSNLSDLTVLKGDKGDKGDKGEKGDTGNAGVVVSETAPTDPDVKLWINPAENDAGVLVELTQELTEEQKKEVRENLGVKDIEAYTGNYVVTPKAESQSLACAGKQMTEDVTINSVPYYETSNQDGTTVYIASEV